MDFNIMLFDSFETLDVFGRHGYGSWFCQAMMNCLKIMFLKS